MAAAVSAGLSGIVLEAGTVANPAGLRGKQSAECAGQSGVHSPIWELQKAVCGWGGAQVHALLEAVSHSNNRVQEARGAKGAMVGSAGRGGGVSGPLRTWAAPPHTQPAWKGIKPLHSGLEGLGGCGDFKRAVGI